MTPSSRMWCNNCSGTGQYHKAVQGRVVEAGVCYRCQGKGYQVLDDVKRNEFYDLHRIVRIGGQS